MERGWLLRLTSGGKLWGSHPASTDKRDNTACGADTPAGNVPRPMAAPTVLTTSPYFDKTHDAATANEAASQG